MPTVMKEGGDARPRRYKRRPKPLRQEKVIRATPNTVGGIAKSPLVRLDAHGFPRTARTRVEPRSKKR